jgi:hypothetical protein
MDGILAFGKLRKPDSSHFCGTVVRSTGHLSERVNPSADGKDWESSEEGGNLPTKLSGLMTGSGKRMGRTQWPNG